jgi:hypothetical protein
MIHCWRGIRDFANRTKLEVAEIYVPSGFKGYNSTLTTVQIAGTDVALAYSYDSNLGAFVADAVAPTHAKLYSPYLVQAGGESFETYVETQNIKFMPEKFKDKLINIFLKAAIGIGSYIVRFVTDSNYRFSDNATEWNMGVQDETASFNATTIRMNGNRKYKLSQIATDHPLAEAIRFRIDAVPRDGQWRVFDLELRTAGLVSETTEIADD